MARPREFDMDEALDGAMNAFWKRGYEATSLTDLMDATGLAKGSIYKAFDDKHNLFMRALKRYLDQVYQDTIQTLEGTASPTEGLRQWLTTLIFGICHDQESQRGCFAINSVVELAPHDEEVAQILEAHFNRMRHVITQLIERGQKTGEFQTAQAARDLTEFVMVFVSGLVSMSKVKLPRAQTQRLVEFTLMTLQGLVLPCASVIPDS